MLTQYGEKLEHHNLCKYLGLMSLKIKIFVYLIGKKNFPVQLTKKIVFTESVFVCFSVVKVLVGVSF